MRNLLSESLPLEDLTNIYNSYDVIGDIAVIRVTESFRKHSQTVAETIMKIHKNIKTVLAQTSPVRGDFRLRKLKFVAGEDKTTTTHKEYGCLFSIDLAKCYFSPRLLFKRMRVAKQVRNGEVVVNMFAGVGCFSILIAKHSKAEKVYSIDVNPSAFECMQKNVRLNRVYGRVIPVKGDAREIIEKRLCCVADRVLMPLPDKASEYLQYALSALKNAGGWICYYDFEHAVKNVDPVEKVKMKVAEKLENLGEAFTFSLGRVVRTIGPNWYQVVLDIKLISCGNKRK